MDKPWKRGIGNNASKIWDSKGRLVATAENPTDARHIVDCVNELEEYKEGIETERRWKQEAYDRAREAESKLQEIKEYMLGFQPFRDWAKEDA